jgi:hypothetical protein
MARVGALTPFVPVQERRPVQLIALPLGEMTNQSPMS